MNIPAPEQQIEFLTNLQRLLREGAFVATYKYAFLMALADIAVERGKDDDSVLDIPTRLIGEKYAQYYWPHAVPYPGARRPGAILKQNTGGPAGVLSALSRFRSRFEGTLVDAQKSGQDWQQTVSEITACARGNPLERLQIVSNAPVATRPDV